MHEGHTCLDTATVEYGQGAERVRTPGAVTQQLHDTLHSSAPIIQLSLSKGAHSFPSGQSAKMCLSTPKHGSVSVSLPFLSPKLPYGQSSAIPAKL